MPISKFPSEEQTIITRFVSTGITEADSYELINSSTNAVKNITVAWPAGVYYWEDTSTNFFPPSNYVNWTTKTYNDTFQYIDRQGPNSFYFVLSTAVTNLKIYSTPDYVRFQVPPSQNDASYGVALTTVDGRFTLMSRLGYATSTDMVTWTTRNPPVSGNQQCYLTVGTGETEKYLFYEVNLTNATYSTSTNETTWTTRSFPSGNQVYNISYFGTSYWMVGRNTSTGASVIAESTDGITWTNRRSVTSNNQGFYKIVYGAGETNQYVAGGAESSDTRLCVSTNGITWTNATLPAGVTSFSITGGIYEGGTYYIYGSGSTNLLTSTDGVTWSSNAITLPHGARLDFQKIDTNKYLYANGTGDGNAVIYSTSLTDGTNDIRTLAYRNSGGQWTHYYGVYSTATTYDYYFVGANYYLTGRHYDATDILQGYFSTTATTGYPVVIKKIAGTGAVKQVP